jgi:hypothetical protein
VDNGGDISALKRHGGWRSTAVVESYTGCLIKNASTHNFFFIYYPISMNKKTEDMVFHALRSSHKIIFFLALFSVAYDSQLFFLNGHM